MRRTVLHISVFAILTALSQLGGIAYLTANLWGHWRALGKIRRLGLFVAFYSLLWISAFLTAPMAGRTALPCLAGNGAVLAMQNPVYCVLNRHYVSGRLLNLAQALATHVDRTHPGTLTMALDAGFPFLDGFALLPHLSHDDGRKLDLAFYYSDKNGRYARGLTRSPIGYWAFEPPLGSEARPCEGRTDWPTLRWDMAWWQPTLASLRFDPERTRTALRWLVQNAKPHGIEKVLIESHIPNRLGVSGQVLRFQGCRVARHDDHIHIQVAP